MFSSSLYKGALGRLNRGFFMFPRPSIGASNFWEVGAGPVCMLVRMPNFFLRAGLWASPMLGRCVGLGAWVGL